MTTATKTITKKEEAKKQADLKNDGLKMKLDELADTLVTDPEKLAMFSKQWSGGFYHYSFMNYLLAYVQKPDFSLLGSYKKWASMERQVKKGEKAIYIRAPRIGYKDSEKIDLFTGKKEKEKFIYFTFVPVFDVAQTDGKEIEIAAKSFVRGESTHTFGQLAELAPVPVIVRGASTKGGSTDGKEITVCTDNINHPSAIASLIHEWAHVLMHFDKNFDRSDRPTVELEAEAVAYIVCSVLNVENNASAYYIGGWKGDPEDLRGRGKRIIQTAEKIIKVFREEEKTEEEK